MHGPLIEVERYILKRLDLVAWIEEERNDRHGPWTE
jgi:hypothetical protein